MNRIVTGILAHVDAGKTTLSESILFHTGAIRKMGRVDDQNAFLDTDPLERSRGITIFCKQALFSLPSKEVTLLDTPGHVDFSTEMERTLQVLDYAILVISGADGVQGHTRTLWWLLKKHRIPVFLFVNKMDQPGTDKDRLLIQLQEQLDSSCVDFTAPKEELLENVAVSEEQLLEQFLESGRLETQAVCDAIQRRKVFPVYFGSALKSSGIEEFLQGFDMYTKVVDYGEKFGARVFKIARDAQGNRLTYLKITGGKLLVKSFLQEEKINQIRLYSGESYEVVKEAEAGCVCAVTGLTTTRPGQGFGIEQEGMLPLLEPVLTYQMILPEGMDAAQVLPKLRQLEEEDPQLHIVWEEQVKEIRVQLMGEIQLEILKSLCKQRFGMDVEFSTGSIVYKETIANIVEGVGHFEPLRHYAEVHLLMEPLPRGSGIELETTCSEDLLDKNWQRLILTHLAEKEHRGVLTGAPLTDVRITLASGRAHLKHTEGGDFRQATYRAVRQGLMQAERVLLEPYYQFRLEVPQQMIGRAMTDVEAMCGTFDVPETIGETAVLTGSAPVATMQEYQRQVAAYTRGEGRLSLTLKGYETCHNSEEVIKTYAYDPTRDLENTPDSVFCAHGAGFLVNWRDVPSYMHLESVLQEQAETHVEEKTAQEVVYEPEEWMAPDEVDRILAQATHANQHEKGTAWKKRKRRKEDYFDTPPVSRSVSRSPQKEYLLVDGYNIIFAWPKLQELAKENIDSARGKLLDILCNYQGIRNCELIVVFDAYRVQGHQTEVSDYHNIHVVYTKEAETADQFIEKFAHENGRKYRVYVATSDGLEQIIIRGQGCLLMSAIELEEEIQRASREMLDAYQTSAVPEKTHLFDHMSEQAKQQWTDLKKN
ncbi:MAG: NYN domain-containing protein [Lachnospiraceae bacterium]